MMVTHLRNTKDGMKYLGNSVKDQNFQFAIFDNLSSAPPVLEAWMAADAVSLQEG